MIENNKMKRGAELRNYTAFKETLKKLEKWGVEGIEPFAKGYEDLKSALADTDKILLDTDVMSSLLDEAKVFEIESALAELLLKTDNKIEKDRLPYPVLFIDADIRLGNRHGIVNYDGLLVWRHENRITNAYSLCISDDDFCEFLVADIFNESEKPIHTLEETDSESKEKVKLFVKNFLDFINEPEVDWVEARAGRRPLPTRGVSYVVCPLCGRKFASRKAYERHVERKLPSARVCKLTGKIKKYVERYKRFGREIRHRRKHWVRGHWRHLRSDYFTHKRGRKVWIPPHVRGDGILVPKTYKLEKR